MDNALMAVQLIFYLMGGLGLFFLGVGVLSFVDVYTGVAKQELAAEGNAMWKNYSFAKKEIK